MAGHRFGCGAGFDRVPAGVIIGTPGDRVADLLRRRRGASFTAVSQLGTEAAVLVYFARDIVRILKAWFTGLFKGLAAKLHRNTDYRLVPHGMYWFVGYRVVAGGAVLILLGNGTGAAT